MKYLVLLLALFAPSAFASCVITAPGHVEFLTNYPSTYAYLEYEIYCEENLPVSVEFPNAHPQGQISLVGNQTGYQVPIHLRNAQSFEVVGSMSNNEHLSLMGMEGRTTIGIEATLHFDLIPPADEYSSVMQVRLIY